MTRMHKSNQSQTDEFMDERIQSNYPTKPGTITKHINDIIRCISQQEQNIRQHQWKKSKLSIMLMNSPSQRFVKSEIHFLLQI